MCVCVCVSICRSCCAEGTATWLRPRYLRCLSCCPSCCCWNTPRVLAKHRRTRPPMAGVTHPDWSSGEQRGSSWSNSGLSAALQLPLLLLLLLLPPVLHKTTHRHVQNTHISSLSSSLQRRPRAAQLNFCPFHILALPHAAAHLCDCLHFLLLLLWCPPSVSYWYLMTVTNWARQSRDFANLKAALMSVNVTDIVPHPKPNQNYQQTSHVPSDPQSISILHLVKTKLELKVKS